MALNYYLTIDGVVGDSQDIGFQGAFDVTDYSIDITELLSGPAGAQTSKPSFTPLTVDLALTSGLTALLKDEILGRRINSIELQGVTSDGHTVYDLKLGDVVVTEIHDASFGQDELTFSYGEYSLTTTALNQDGTLGASTTASWNLAADTQSVSIPTPVVPTIGPSSEPTGSPATKYYLTIDGMAGDSLASGHKGAFDVGNFDLDVSALLSGLSGAGASTPTFSPLTVDLPLGTNVSALLQAEVTGHEIDSLELQGVSLDGKTVYDLKLGKVFVSEIDNNGQQAVSFNYHQISLTTTPLNLQGTLGNPTTVSYDLDTKMQNVSIAPPVVAASSSPSVGVQKYFLLVDGIAGGSQANGFQGAFSITDFNFDIKDAAAGGAGASTPNFSPLTVDLNLGSGLAALFEDGARGQHINSVELKGVSSDGKTLYDLELGDVFVTKLHDTSSGPDQLQFSYGQFSLTTRPESQTGSLGTPTTVSFNLVDKTQTVDIPAPTTPSTAPTGAPHAQAYYLTVDGVFGDSQVTGHKGAFAISDYSFDVSSLISTSGGLPSPGRASFSPLTIDLPLNSGLTALLKEAATGQHFNSIELQGVLANNGGTVYDLKLGDVFVTSIEDTTNGQDKVSFDYGQISLTTRGQNLDGSLTAPTTESWNRLTDNPNVSIPNPVVPSVGPDSAPDGAPVHSYFLTIDGIAGDSKADGHIGAFTIEDFNLKISNPVTLSGGAGAGKPTFSPLTIDLNLASGLTALLKDEVTGHKIDSLELQGVSFDGKTVYDLKLGDVFVSEVQDANTGQDALSFTYQQISVTTTAEDDTGTLGNSSTMSWNLSAGNESVSIGTPLAPSGSPTGTAARNYFLTVDGVVGGSQATGHVGAFTIAGFNFDVTNPVNPASGTGGSASKPNFSPLTIDLDQSPSLAALVKDDVIGHRIRSIELAGVGSGGGTVYDLKLGDVLVSEVKDTNTGHDVLSFSFDQFSLTTRGQNPNGTLGPANTVSWNLGTDNENVNIPTPVPGANSPPVAVDDSAIATTGIGGTASGNVLANDSDADGDILTVTPFDGDLAHGHLTLVANGDFTYTVTDLTGATGSHLHDDFTYSESDGHGNTASASLDITLNRAPIAAGDTALATTGIGGTAAGNVLTNDSDPDGDTLTVTPASLTGSHGTLALNADGSYSYTVTDLTGPTGSHLHDSFTYSESDGFGGTASAPLNITLNRAPIAVADTALAAPGIGGTASGNVLANDSDPDGDALTVAPESITGSHGTLALNADGSYTYTVTDLTGPTGSHLHDSFTYSESDGFGGTASAPLDITLNRAPIAVADTALATTGIGGTASGNVLANDSDPDGDALTVAPFSGPTAHGTLTLNADGTFSYAVTDLTGPTGSHLHDIFTYTESDGFGGTASANLDITLNRAPVVLADLAGVKSGATVSGNVLTDDSDPDGDALTVTAINGGTVGQPIAGSFGTLTLNSDGSYSYVANKGAPGQPFAQDVFSFSESDGFSGTVQSSLAVSIVGNGQSYIAGQPGQTLSPGNGKEIIDGSLGTQHLLGGNGADVLVGGPGDVLTGGNGPDLFVFRGAFGANEITDLGVPDTIQLDRSIFGSVSDILAHDTAADGLGNTIITDPHHTANTIKLDNVSVSQLHASQFTLV